MRTRTLVIVLLTAAAVFFLTLPALVGAFSQSDTAYYDGFADLTGIDPATSKNVTIDALGGLRLVTNGPSKPAVWTSAANFTNPVAPLGPLVGLSTLDATKQPGTLSLATSPLAFRRAQAGPTLSPPPPLSVDGYAVGGMSVVRVDDQYVMWYTGVPENGYVKTIYRATSPDGITWTKEATPVLTLGDPGTFDSRQLGKPWVIYDLANVAAPYRMWYSAEGDFGGSIGYATSTDGVTWTKAGEVLPPGPRNSPDSYSAQQPCVVIDNGVYRMWYTASDSNNLRVAYATSTDGLAWQRGGVVFDVAGGNFGQGAWAPTVWKDAGGDFHMLFTGNKIVAGDQIQAKLINGSSPDGVTWTSGSIAVNPGNQTAGDFDGFNLSQPDVLVDPADPTNPYKLWYVGNNPDANGNYHDRVGYATSDNGSKWTKAPGPAGDPYWNAVLTLGTQSTAFDSMMVADLRTAARPEALGGGAYGFYTGTNAADFVQRVGVKVKTGTEWEDAGLGGSGALLDVGASGGFDAEGVASPAPVYDAANTRYDVYYAGRASGGDLRIGLAEVSEDLLTVTRPGTALLGASPYDSGGAADPWAVLDGTQIAVFYAGMDAGGTWSICRAGAPLATPANLASSGQLLTPTAGTYDAAGLRYPVAVKDSASNGWHLWYEATDDQGVKRIAYATSDNGTTWTKRGLAMAPSPQPFDFAERGLRPSWGGESGGSWTLVFTGTDRYGWTRVGDARATGAGYIDSGSATYELDNPTPQDWRKITWNPATIPDGTTREIWVSYYPTYSNLWSSWIPVNNGTDLPLLLSVQNVRWQARMTSSDPSASPLLADLTIDHADIHFPATGKAVTLPIGPPDGKYLLTWGELTINADIPGGTAMNVTVKDEGGAVLVPSQPVAAAPISLAAVPATSGKLVLVFSLASDATQTLTPRLKSLDVTYTTTSTPATMTLTVDPTVITYGGAVAITGSLMSDATPLAGQTVTIEKHRLGTSTFLPVATVQTQADGTFTVPSQKPGAGTVYKASWPGGDVAGTVYPPAVAQARVDVKPKVALRMSNYTSRSGVYYRYPMGRKVVAKGSVAPSHATLDGSTTRGTVTIRAYKRTYSSTTKTYVWKNVKTVTRTLTSTSTYTWGWYPKVRGNYKVRTTFPGDTAHLKTFSVYRYVKIY